MTYDEWMNTPQGAMALTIAARCESYTQADRVLRTAFDAGADEHRVERLPVDLAKASEALLKKVNATAEDHDAMNALLQSARATGYMEARHAPASSRDEPPTCWLCKCGGEIASSLSVCCFCNRQRADASVEGEPLTSALQNMEARKDEAYEERNRVVAAFAWMSLWAGWQAGTARTSIPGWSDDWHGCVYIELPHGQVSWHFHDSHAHLFAGLPAFMGKWDGHDTPTKYERVAYVCEVLRDGGRLDKPLPEDAEIDAAHPLKTGDYETWHEAQRMVGAKRSKYALIDLLNWAMVRNRADRQALYNALRGACESIAVHGEQPPQTWLDALGNAQAAGHAPGVACPPEAWVVTARYVKAPGSTIRALCGGSLWQVLQLHQWRA